MVQRNRSWFIDIAGVIALVAALIIINPVPSAAVGPPALDVTVTNSDANPIPVRVISAGTVLVWRTPPGGQSVEFGTVLSPVLDVHGYRTIRLTGNNRCQSPGSVTVLLTSVTDNEFFAFIDQVTVAPCQSFSRSYDVPGSAVVVQAQSGQGTSIVDFLIDGHE